MGKKDKEPPTPVTIISSKEPPGMKIDFSEMGDWKYWLVLAPFLCLIYFSLRAIFGDGGPQYRPRPEPWAGWPVVLTVVAIVLGVVAIIGIAYLAGLVYLGLQRRRAEVVAAERDSELIHAEGGVFPWRRATNGDLHNMNAAPAGIIRADGTMPDPETPAQHHAAERAAVVQVAAAGHTRSPFPVVAPAPPPARELPAIQVISGERLADLEHRLSAGKEEG